MKSFLLIMAVCSQLYAEPFLENFEINNDFPYRNPSHRFLDEVDYKEIEKGLMKQGFNLKQKDFYFAIIEQEEPGYIGYTASGHKFRVFQDIIRITLEEILDFEFKRDFFFFRVPGDPAVNNHFDALDFLKTFGDINDNLSEQRDQLISTNFSIFNNYDQKYECSAVFFENSISYKPPNFERKIAAFFEELGMLRKRVENLFRIGEMLKNREGGTLFQIFDFSHHDPLNNSPYDFIDRYGYPCTKKGEPTYSNIKLSELFQGTSPTTFLSQYRIVINHEGILNPYSSISMRRYDLNDPIITRKYEIKLRAAIRRIPYDYMKARLYKERLEKKWGLK